MPIVDTYALSDLTKLAVAVADVDRFYRNLVTCLPFNVSVFGRISLKSDVVSRVMVTYAGLQFFRGHGVESVAYTRKPLRLHNFDRLCPISQCLFYSP